MSEKQLEIFEPLKTYFAILCQSDCYNYNSSNDCKGLIDLLSSENCDTAKGLSKNFLDSLSRFIWLLKKADTPIGLYTIKNKLETIFKSADVSDFINSVVKAVDSASDLSGFKMNQDNGEGKTYEEILKTVYDSAKTIEQNFNDWFRSSFDTYAAREIYFETNIKPNINNLDDCEAKLLNDFFEVKVDGSKVSIKDYIARMNTDLKDKKARLNVKIESDRPRLFVLFPESVKEALEAYLVNPQEGSPVLYETPECYKLKISSKEPKKEEYKVPEPKAVLKWFREEAQGIRKRTVEQEVKDADDNEEYVDIDNEKYTFPNSFQNVINYQDNWRADLSGRLWKKNAAGKFEEYTDANLEADSKLFESKDGHCGNLCIFNDATKCSQFFERMMKRDDMKIDELAAEINSANFVRSYKALKDNIVNVNPLFVIGTLRMFGFDKYTELKEDGTKTVKIESFTRWWGRFGNKLSLSPVSPFPGSHKGLTPEPPANLELFFKLLIAFINNNEFVLNPQSKELINKSGKPKVSEYGAPKKSFMINGKEVANKYYEQEMAIYEGRNVPSNSQPESLSNLVEIMRKNALLSSKPINMGLPENRTNLSTLLNLMIGVTSGGKVRLSKMQPYSTGKGYILGGGPVLLPCAGNATEIYKIGIDAMNKKNKKLSSSLNEDLKKQLDDLETLEQEVYEKLSIMANYVKVINVMNDEAANSDITFDMMNNIIKEYESKSNKLSSKTDSTISMLLKNLFDEKSSGPSSYYSKMN